MRGFGILAVLLGLAGLKASDDLAPMSDEFDNPLSFPDWIDLGVTEGWVTPSYETADIDTTESGRFHIVPGALTWFNHLRGLLLYKEVTGDFVATAKLRVLSRHNPADPSEVPNESFSLTGILAHGPRPVVQAAPNPYTTAAVWPPGDFGSDYLPNTENFIFLSYGSAGNPGTRQFEIKATRNSQSRLYFDSTGIDQGETEVWLQMVRVGDTVVCLRKHAAAGPWFVENRYPNPDHPFPDFGATLQVGITAYTDWDTAQPFAFPGGGADPLQTSYHFNYAPPSDGDPDLISQVDYFRFRRPDPALGEAVLQGMAVSYDPNTNSTADPPVQLAASVAAEPYLGEAANDAYDPFGIWQVAEFGADAGEPVAQPEEDPEGDRLANVFEFVLGGDPEEDSSELLPQGRMDGGDFVFSFTPAVEDGAILRVMASDGLSGWTPLARRPRQGGAWVVEEAGVAVNVDGVTGEVEVSFAPGPDARFVRLEGSL